VSEHNSSGRRLMRAGYSYGGDSTGVRMWARPGGGLVFEPEALAELDQHEEQPMSEYVQNFDGTDPLDADVIEDLVAQEYPHDRLKRLLFRHCIFYVKMERDGRTLRDVWDWFDVVAALPLAEQRRVLDPVRVAAGYPTFAQVESERRLKAANSRLTPSRIGVDDSGGFAAEPVRHDRHLHRVGPNFEELPSEAETDLAERREQELREGDKQRNEARRREAEREREREEAGIPGLFGQ
jgi:hypothetical protein